MSTNIVEVPLSEAVDTEVYFIAAVRGYANLVVQKIELRVYGIAIEWTIEDNTFTAVVPWSNIKAVSQIGA